jgi:iron complex outermembrane recepter protein
MYQRIETTPDLFNRYSSGVTMLRILAVPMAAVMISTGAVRAQVPDTTLFRLPALSVIATRTPLRVLDVALAVSVIGKAEYENTNGYRIDEALRSVPGVLAQSRFGTSDIRIVVRGFGARGAGDRSNAGTTRGVRILQDGIPETEPDGRTALDLIDLASVDAVEVVRSNASALWGNASGALINFSSIPSGAGNKVVAEYAVGGFGLQRQVVQGMAQFSSGQLYATFTNTSTDGWRQNSQAERKLANIGITTSLGEKGRLRAHAVAADNKFNIPGPLTLMQYDTAPTMANPTYLSRRERRNNRIGRLSVEVDRDLASGTTVQSMIYVNPKYLQRSERGTFRDFTRYHIGGNLLMTNKHDVSSSLRGSLTAGFDEAYQDGAILFYSLSPTQNRGTTLSDNKREGANNFGFFLQEILSFGKLDLTLGGRYDNITYYSDSFINPTLNADRSFEKVTPKVGVLYRLSSDHSVYANLGGGVEVPAGNETDAVPPANAVTSLNPLLDPIRSTTFEVGTKQLKTFASGVLRSLEYDIALYRTNVTNEIVPYNGGRFYFTAAEAERMGAEVGLRVSSAGGFSVNTAWTFSDNRYRDYVVDSMHYNRPGQLADYSDNKIVGIPDAFFTVNVGYVPTFVSALGLDFEVQRVGKYFSDDANVVEIPAYTLLNGTVALRRPVRLGGGLEARGFVRAENLGDQKYVASAFLNPDRVAGQPATFEPGLPRHAVLGVSLGWSR